METTNKRGGAACECERWFIGNPLRAGTALLGIRLNLARHLSFVQLLRQIYFNSPYLYLDPYDPGSTCRQRLSTAPAIIGLDIFVDKSRQLRFRQSTDLGGIDRSVLE